MNTIFQCSGSKMDSIKTNIENAKKYMDQAYLQALALQHLITDKEDWTGKTELVAEAFLDLVVQYQKAFNGSESPTAKAISALEELDTNLDSFFTKWEDYVNLKEF